jgi:phosphatidylglycerophosphate synthase
MSTSGRWLVACLLAVAVWVSDRWAWVLPALLAVLIGVAIARIHRRRRGRKATNLPASEWSVLLILTGFLYLDVYFLLFESARSAGRASPGLLVGFVVLLAILTGLVAVFLLNVKIPRWLSKLWRQLLEER